MEPKAEQPSKACPPTVDTVCGNLAEVKFSQYMNAESGKDSSPVKNSSSSKAVISAFLLNTKPMSEIFSASS